MIFWLIAVIGIISVVWAFISFKRENKKHEMHHVKKEMAKGRVIYYSSSDKESSS
ncbi:MAG: hypothetical protein AAB520_04135 [Patescibacteria group bacterium]